MDTSTGIFSDVVFSYGTAPGDTANAPGGCLFTDNCIITMNNSTMTHCRGGIAAGWHILGTSSVTVTNSQFLFNQADFGGWGGSGS